LPSEKDLGSHLFGDSHNWNIIGFGEQGSQNWETERQMTTADLDWITEVVVHSPREGREDDWFTLHGPWDEIEDLEGQIDEEEDHYGQAA
jgi:hypothetical protein